MLTGGIDLSVGAIASASGFVVATLVSGRAPGRHRPRLIAAGLVGLVNGIGIGVFKVHPLIMTLGMAWSCSASPTSGRSSGADRRGGPARVPHARVDLFLTVIPYSLIVFVPVALLILLGLRRTGYGRLLYAIGDNPIAARLSGARAWQVLIVLYVISAVLAGIAGFLIAGLTNVASVTLADSYVLPSVAAAVIGGTSIPGGRGGFGGTIVGALILTVITSLLARWGTRRPSARSCSARSSWPWRPPTPGSPRSRDRWGDTGEPAGRDPPSRSRPGGHEPQMGDGRAGRRRVGDLAREQAHAAGRRT